MFCTSVSESGLGTAHWVWFLNAKRQGSRSVARARCPPGTWTTGFRLEQADINRGNKSEIREQKFLGGGSWKKGETDTTFIDVQRPWPSQGRETSSSWIPSVSAATSSLSVSSACIRTMYAIGSDRQDSAARPTSIHGRLATSVCLRSGVHAWLQTRWPGFAEASKDEILLPRSLLHSIATFPLQLSVSMNLEPHFFPSPPRLQLARFPLSLNNPNKRSLPPETSRTPIA